MCLHAQASTLSTHLCLDNFTLIVDKEEATIDCEAQCRLHGYRQELVADALEISRKYPCASKLPLSLPPPPPHTHTHAHCVHVGVATPHNSHRPLIGDAQHSFDTQRFVSLGQLCGSGTSGDTTPVLSNLSNSVKGLRRPSSTSS